MNEDFLSINDFAKILKIHPNTVRRQIKKGKINIIKFGSEKKPLYRIPKSEIERLAFFTMKDVVKKIMEEEKNNG